MSDSSASSSVAEPAGQELPPGTRLEEFVVERVLGSGGFGITYLARDDRLGRRVVIKENLPVQFAYRDPSSLTVGARHSRSEDAEDFAYSLRSFEEEAAMLASLDHPGIVRVLRSFEANGTAYFVMPYVEGHALSEQILHRRSSGAGFSEDEVRGLLWWLLEALEYLHDRGIYHRDIKPGNILVTSDGRPVLIDFGAARQQLGERSLTVVESPGYTPFEQLQSKGRIGPWSDLYALGGTLYKAITGETPAKATDRILDDSLVPLAGRAELRWRYSARLLSSIDRAMAPRAEDRFEVAREWLDLLTGGDGEFGREHDPPFASRQVMAPVSGGRRVQELAKVEAEEAEKRIEPASEVPSREASVSGASLRGVRPPEPEPSALPPSSKKRSAGNRHDRIAVIVGVLGVVGLAIVILVSSRSPRPPSGWNPAQATQEEVDRYAEAGVLSALVERSVRVLEAALDPGNPEISPEILAEAIHNVRIFAEAGDVYSMYLLGLCLRDGLGMPMDESEAVEWWRKAAVLGDAEAMTRIGFAYYYGDGGLEEDQRQAVQWWRKAAELGEPEAMGRLGLAFYTGDGGLSEDKRQAVEWWLKAAELGDAQAMGALGHAYNEGEGGLTKDPRQAVEWWRKAAELGNTLAMSDVGLAYYRGQGGLEEDPHQSVTWWRKAAELGDAGAMFYLGLAYLQGEGGLAEDPRKAVQWWRKAAELGEPDAMFYLGLAYLHGGLEEDPREAVQWWRKAAELGEPEAMFYLGLAYLQGEGGLEEDPREAVQWWRKAAELGETEAMLHLGLAYYLGEGGLSGDPMQAVEWWRKAAELGDAGAMFHLGDAYYDGEGGLAKDRRRAMEWWRKAEAAGYELPDRIKGILADAP